MGFSVVGVTPLLQVFDMPAALAFYRDVLGFSVISASPEVETPEGRFSHWVWLRLGAVSLMLNTQYDSGERPPAPVGSRTAAHGDTCLFIGCSDVDLAYEQLQGKGLQAAPPGRGSLWTEALQRARSGWIRACLPRGELGRRSARRKAREHGVKGRLQCRVIPVRGDKDQVVHPAVGP